MLDCKSNQVSVGDLLGTLQTREEWAAQMMPIVREGQIGVNRMLPDPPGSRRGVSHGHLSGALRGRIAKKACFRERANGPLAMRCIEPFGHSG